MLKLTQYITYQTDNDNTEMQQDTLRSELERCSCWVDAALWGKTCRGWVTGGLHLLVKGTLLIAKELLEMVLCGINPILLEKSRSWISLSWFGL